MDFEFKPLPWPPARPRDLAAQHVDLWWFSPEFLALNQSNASQRDWLVRATLGAYMKMPADALRLARSKRGKPYLNNANALAFNLSDCRGHILLAVAAHDPIGIDLERTDRDMDAMRIARRWFCPDEISGLEALTGDALQLAFLHLWTAKEAACKAAGTGISGHLGQWCFAVAPSQPTLLHAPTEAEPANAWHFVRTSPAPGFTAALATRGFAPRIHAFQAIND